MKTESKIFFYLLIALVALIVADGIITRTLIVSNLAVESNPFLRTWVESDMLLVIKLVGATSAAFILWRVSKIRPKISLAISCLFVIFYIGVIIWNLFVFFTTQYYAIDLSGFNTNLFI
jgi:hypothetical protein